MERKVELERLRNSSGASSLQVYLEVPISRASFNGVTDEHDLAPGKFRLSAGSTGLAGRPAGDKATTTYPML
jgi:hypothetical protein